MSTPCVECEGDVEPCPEGTISIDYDGRPGMVCLECYNYIMEGDLAELAGARFRERYPHLVMQIAAKELT